MAFILPLPFPAGVNDAGAGQIVFPYADVSNSGWLASTGTDLFAMLNEEAPDDGDHVSSSVGAVTDVFTVRLQVLNTVTTSTGDTNLIYRAGKVDNTGTYTTDGPTVMLKVELLTPAGNAFVPAIERTDSLGLLAQYSLNIPADVTLDGEHLVRVTKSVI